MSKLQVSNVFRKAHSSKVHKGEHVIAPPKRIISLDLNELWQYRDLFLVLAWRDIAVRYKQTALGVLWAVLQPAITMIIFSFIFNRMAGIESGDGTPYPVFVYVGLMFWQYFSGTLTNASNSLVLNVQLIQKTYFPRMILPAASAITGFVDFCIASVVLGVLMLYYGFNPHLKGLLILPILLLDTTLCAAGAGLLTAALNIKYRDVRHALPFFIQIMVYITPVIYPVKLLDKHPLAKLLMLWLNPMASVIANARAGLFGKTPINWDAMGISTFVSVMIFLSGLYYFRHTEHYFADIA